MAPWTLFVVALLSPAAGNGPPEPGTTIITHGFQFSGELPGWVQIMAAGIAAVALEETGLQATVLRYEPGTGHWSHVSGSQDPDAEIVCVFDWAADSGWPIDRGEAGTAPAAADALYAALRDAQLPGGLEGESLLEKRRLHLISHSRGTVVNSEAVRRLVLAGYSVDQVTTLDPHPVDGDPDPVDFLDPEPVTWEGVVWADNYWRADSGADPFDFAGQEVFGANNVDLGGVLKSGDLCLPPIATCGCEHIKVHVWYHGTIDLDAGSDGDCDIERGPWYSNGGDGEGYFFSDLIGGTRPDEGSPGSGRVTATPVPAVVNGDLEFESDAGGGRGAGWRYHGGEIESSWVVHESGNLVLKLGSGFGSSSTHNRFQVPQDASALFYKVRVATTSPDDVLEVVISNLDDESALLSSIPLSIPTGELVSHTNAIPEPFRGRTCRVTFGVQSSAGGVEAVVWIDDVDLGGCVWDLNGDGTVGVGDLLALLTAWGTDPGGPPDFDGDGNVGIGDMLALFANWGPCL